MIEKIYKKTEEHKRNLSLALKGKHISLETEFKKGRNNPNKRKDLWNNPKIKEMYLSGKSIKEISKESKCSYNLILRILKRKKVPTEKNWRIKEKNLEILNYYNEGKSANEISKILNSDYGLILKIIKKNNINLRPHSFYIKGKESSKRMNIDKEVIFMYKNNIPGQKIAEHFNCDNSVIYNILHKNNIEIKGTKYFNKGKISHRRGKTWEEEYGEEKARKLKIKQSAIEQGIPLEKWNGFVGFNPYGKEFNNQFKLLIRQRDGFLCLKCGTREDDHIKLFKRKLFIHHIDYNKKLTIPENCCVLCLRCNSEVNSNRNSWKKFFQSMLSERYGYQYSENGEMILTLNNELVNYKEK